MRQYVLLSSWLPIMLAASAATSFTLANKAVILEHCLPLLSVCPLINVRQQHLGACRKAADRLDLQLAVGKAHRFCIG
jgi:hypothetical protein